MANLGDRIKHLREKLKFTQKDLSKKTGLTIVQVSRYENNERKPDPEALSALVDALETNADYLLCRTDDPSSSKPYYTLTKKDERDIAKDLERMMSDLESNEAMAFNGEPMDDETRELVRISLENSMRLAKEMAKKKFTPKKYRGNEDE
ncbi:helix-turn-helix domain-containing protein [Xylanibacillus composti]|uniref:Transcriptional regulator n=1 Tax=Xylanibacillus composti TaxID=1572762 RepID=A0A8J4GY90_9BACL|nr:helix-turn-helix domain-containing protein [Xylanibacillus composti]MDT9723825.1 helix-turn-helix domain-containing protein [Xylanibacillus composti]GIQ67397.1 transcriptional regulator [Xylanibacillus composti]